MQIKTSSDAINYQIDGAWQEIQKQLQGEKLQKLNETQLLIVDDKLANDVLDDEFEILKRAYSSSFGASKGNIVIENVKCHLVVLNMTMINELNLDKSELISVLSHELGHIFNKYTDKPVPSVLYGAHINSIQAAQNENQLNREIYADYFCKLTNSETGLKTSMEKFMASSYSNNIDIFSARLEALNGENVYIGTVLEVK